MANKSDRHGRAALRGKIEHVLARFVAMHTEVSDIEKDIAGVFSHSPECRFSSVLWLMFWEWASQYANGVGVRRDDLEWYCYDNEMGKRGLTCQIGSKVYKISGIKDYARFLEKQQ